VNPNQPAWGRRVLISIPDSLAVPPGELVDISFSRSSASRHQN